MSDQNRMLGLLSPHQRHRMGNALMAEQYNRPVPHDTLPAERATLLPLATYQNGMTGPALPGLLTQPVESFNNLLRYGYTPGTGDVAGVEDALNVAGGAFTGGLLAPRVAGAVAANRFTIPDHFGNAVSVLGNPTPKETAGFINRTKHKAARRVVDPATGDVYIWDGGEALLHEHLAKKLGIDPKRMTADMIYVD